MSRLNEGYIHWIADQALKRRKDSHEGSTRDRKRKVVRRRQMFAALSGRWLAACQSCELRSSAGCSHWRGRPLRECPSLYRSLSVVLASLVAMKRPRVSLITTTSSTTSPLPFLSLGAFLRRNTAKSCLATIQSTRPVYDDEGRVSASLDSNVRTCLNNC